MNFIQTKLICYLIILQIAHSVFCLTELETKTKIYQQDTNVGFILTKYKLNDYGLKIEEKCNTSNLLFNDQGLVNGQLISDIQRAHFDTKRGFRNPRYYLSLYNNLQELLAKVSLRLNFKNTIEHGPRNSRHDNSHIETEMRSILTSGFRLNFDYPINGHRIDIAKSVEATLNQILEFYLKCTFAQKPIKKIKFEMKITGETFKTSYEVGKNKLKLTVCTSNNKTELNLCIKRNTGQKICQNGQSLSIDAIRNALHGEEIY